MQVRISKDYPFSASHMLDHLPEGHPCARLHGHNYVATAVLEGISSKQTGMLVDYNDLNATFGSYIANNLEHRHLNDVLGSGLATTAENLSTTLAKILVDIVRLAGWTHVTAVEVAVSETPKTSATTRRKL